MAETVCAFTGHRAAKLPWGFDESDERALALKRRLFDVVEAVCSTGVRSFVCGMANGCDLYFAEAVLAQRETYPDVRLEAAIPYAGQADAWSAREKARYQGILERCDARTVLREAYTAECMMERNRYMVDKCAILLVCYDGKSGGTLSTLRYALALDREIIQIPVES